MMSIGFSIGLVATDSNDNPDNEVSSIYDTVTGTVSSYVAVAGAFINEQVEANEKFRAERGAAEELAAKEEAAVRKIEIENAIEKANDERRAWLQQRYWARRNCKFPADADASNKEVMPLDLQDNIQVVISNMVKSVSTELYNTFNDHYVNPEVTDIRCLVNEDSYIKSGYEKAKGLAGYVLFEADAHPYATAGIIAVIAGSVYAYQQYSKNDTEVKNS